LARFIIDNVNQYSASLEGNIFNNGNFLMLPKEQYSCDDISYMDLIASIL